MDDWVAAGMSFLNSFYPELIEDDEEYVQNDTDEESQTLFSMKQALFPNLIRKYKTFYLD